LAVENCQSEAVELVKLLGSFGEKLADFCRQQSRAATTKRGVECKDYETGPIIEVWAEVSFRPGYAVVWWMDVTPTADQMWLLSGHVSINGQETVHEESAESLSFADMTAGARTMLADLLAIPPPG
jgi:hypothetical protein